MGDAERTMKRLGLCRLHALQDWRQASIKSPSTLMTKMLLIRLRDTRIEKECCFPNRWGLLASKLCKIVIILKIVKNMNGKKIEIHNRDKLMKNKNPAKINKLTVYDSINGRE